jgi:type I restriction enzyme, R subunit
MNIRVERERHVRVSEPVSNDFLVINQFRVDSSKVESIKLDLVIFVNGVPLVVIEAKSPVIKEPVHNAIEQLLRYSNQRGSHEPEGAEQVFHYNLLCVATCFDFAKIGTIGAKHKHYQEWKDPYPLTLEALAAQLGRQPSAQQMLISSVFAKDRLLDILYNFTLLTEVSGRRVKIVLRYHQYRAVGKSIEALHRPHGATPPGLPDERSGIVWHTQGSGKSFTMTYLVRKMRTLAALREYKIVVITNRRNLQKKLVETARLSGDALQIARSVGDLKRKLEQPGSGLVFGMIQKFRGEQDENAEAAKIPANLNSSEKILLMVDEAHRSHARTFHATLMAALPNCAKMGFTGTPIFQKDKKRTEDIFGKFIDTYTIVQSQIDGATLPIFYEGRTANGVVAGGESINKLFDNLFKEHSEDEKELIRRKYGRYEDVAEAPKLIAEKAKDMLRHFVAHILPGGFKAQVVASSRLAAVRYQAAFENAHNELVTALETQGDLLDGLDAEDDALDAETVLLLRALPHLEMIKRLEFAAIISGAHNDEPLFYPWTDPSKQDTQITRFKRPLADDPLAFIVVNAMLLTGFDAPVEQVLYLDRSIQDQDLLQAIARVNRPEEGKNYGLVVDYFGVAHHLTKALELYAAADIERALIDWRDQLPRLQEAHRKVIEVFAQAKVPLSETETCALFLADERTRAEFTVTMRAFNAALDAVLPRPEGLAYLGDLKQLGFIQRRAANLYRDQTVDLADAEKKIRALIDRYIEVEQVSLKVAPLEVFSPDFSQYVQSLPSKRSQAAEMKHAARHYVTTHAPEDPVFYGKLKERLERILHDHLEHWDAQSWVTATDAEPLTKYSKLIGT